MTGNKLFDCQEMFRHACTFCECADLALCKFQHDTADIGFYTTPAIVNSAFACEVFLKTLLFYNKIEYGKKHNLEALYKMLPDHYKETIEDELLKRYGKMQNAFGISYLSNISKAFEIWRYSFEKKQLQIEIGFLFAFRDLLRDICCKELYKMAWDDYKER